MTEPTLHDFYANRSPCIEFTPASEDSAPQRFLGTDQTIVGKIASFINRFVYIKDESLYHLIALWIVATYIYQEFQYMGYLFIHSPEKQCGKTRLLEVLNWLVSNSAGIECSPTPAVIFRTAENHTQLFDEADGWQEPAVLRNVLNAGFQKDGQVTRLEPVRGVQKPRTFKVFAPRALAGIGTDILSGTTKDRTFMISLVRQKKSEKREKMRGRNVAKEAQVIREEIQNWVKENCSAVIALYNHEDGFDYLEEFADRTVDITEPLATILEVAYRDSQHLGSLRSILFTALQLARSETIQTPRHILILKGIAERMPGDEITEQARTFAQMCGVTDVDEYEVGTTLRKFKFEQHSARIDGEPRKGYTVQKSRLLEIIERYGGAMRTQVV